MRFLTFLFVLFVCSLPCRTVAQDFCRLAFWNVENLFDTQDDSTRNDDEFTPTGKNNWTAKRYKTKQQNLCKTIIAMGSTSQSGSKLEMPLAIGLAEVENGKVLRDLCNGTPLRKFKYKYIHYDSPDKRGIDNALLYRSDVFKPFLSKNICTSDSSRGFYTRDILLVEGTTGKGDTIILLVNHFPSKRNIENEQHRIVIAQQLRHIMDTLLDAHPSAAIIAMGDFNAAPDEKEMRSILLKKSGCRFVNLMANKKGSGSYKYQGEWSFIDQIIVSENVTRKGGCRLQLKSEEGEVFNADFLLVDDERYLGKKTNRTYLGPRYNGGYSDHLPVYVDLYRTK